MTGKANPKSTTGRLDIFVRLMTEGGAQFEEVPKGYSGDLFVEIVPRTFSILVQAGTRLNQLRFWRGNPERDDDDLRRLAQKRQLVYFENQDTPRQPPHEHESRVSSYENGDSSARPLISRGLHLSVDLQGTPNQNIVAYKAKEECPPIDLSKVGAYQPAQYWDFITSQSTKRLVLKPGEFYLLASKERVSVPPSHAAEMEQYDPSLGEFSVHYAGFFDPGFGYGRDGEIKGTRAVLEVRAHEVPILLEEEQSVGRLVYHKMAGAPDKLYGQAIGSSYQQQGLALSKQFAPSPLDVPLVIAQSLK
jgi:dCTP deaminase